uniref:Syntaxin n=1 Tax=Heterorhabditis bacteriophora TaxID=37862 RepID=A0A1I7WZP8_HETBA
MKSSATAIAQSLSEFGRTLRETELPNDVETTARVLQIQTAEKDAIKEDFRISVRKGLSLLRSVRQLESKPRHEQLSPTRLHNVTAIERMLVQLEETERSFDTFWAKHEKRLMNCLQLRQFEDSFRKVRNLTNFRVVSCLSANSWCRKGVDILSSVPLDVSASTASLDALSQSPSVNGLILLTTTETSTLLAQASYIIIYVVRTLSSPYHDPETVFFYSA